MRKLPARERGEPRKEDRPKINNQNILNLPSMQARGREVVLSTLNRADEDAAVSEIASHIGQRSVPVQGVALLPYRRSPGEPLRGVAMCIRLGPRAIVRMFYADLSGESWERCWLKFAGRPEAPRSLPDALRRADELVVPTVARICKSSRRRSFWTISRVRYLDPGGVDDA